MNKQFCQPINKLRLFWLISSLFILSGCFKEKFPKDPLNTLSNQLVCKVNGNIWKSNENPYSGFYLNSTSNKRYLFLDYANGDQEIQIYINPPYDQTTYLLNKNTLDYPTGGNPENHMSFKQWYSDLTPEEFYITDSQNTGRVEFVVMDSVNHRAKGKFSFKGKEHRTGKMITVTDGYFEYHQ